MPRIRGRKRFRVEDGAIGGTAKPQAERAAIQRDALRDLRERVAAVLRFKKLSHVRSKRALVELSSDVVESIAQNGDPHDANHTEHDADPDSQEAVEDAAPV